MARLKGPLICLALSILITLGLHQSATDAEQEIERVHRGRRAGMAQLLAAFGRMIGPTGSLVLGGVLVALCLAWMVVEIRSPAAERSENPTT